MAVGKTFWSNESYQANKINNLTSKQNKNVFLIDIKSVSLGKMNRKSTINSGNVKQFQFYSDLISLLFFNTKLLQFISVSCNSRTHSFVRVKLTGPLLSLTKPKPISSCLYASSKNKAEKLCEKLSRCHDLWAYSCDNFLFLVSCVTQLNQHGAQVLWLQNKPKSPYFHPGT